TPTGTPAAVPGAASGWREQVASGLQGLGWSAKEAEAACEEVEPLAGEAGASVALLMRAALQTLAKT
ncbi:MAG: Holliday junction branch migration protein RuvA, partial [Actinomycetes bacterium]